MVNDINKYYQSLIQEIVTRQLSNEDCLKLEKPKMQL